LRFLYETAWVKWWKRRRFSRDPDDILWPSSPHLVILPAAAAALVIASVDPGAFAASGFTLAVNQNAVSAPNNLQWRLLEDSWRF